MATNKIIGIALFVMILFAPSYLDAHGYKREISVSYGLMPASNIYISRINDFRNNPDYESVLHFGPLSAEYYVRESSFWSMGCIGILAGSKCRVAPLVGYGKRLSTQLTFMAAGKRHWIDNGGFGFYSKAAIGLSMNAVCHLKAPIIMPNFQISPVGLDFRFTPSFSSFLEIGAGEQGVIHAGLSFKIL